MTIAVPESEHQPGDARDAVRRAVGALLAVAPDLDPDADPVWIALNSVTAYAEELGFTLEQTRMAARALTPQQEAHHAQRRRRRAADRSNLAQARVVWDRDGWECVSCGGHTNLTVGHIVSVENGGTDDLENKVTQCGSCNSATGTRTVVLLP